MHIALITLSTLLLSSNETLDRMSVMVARKPVNARLASHVLDETVLCNNNTTSKIKGFWCTLSIRHIPLCNCNSAQKMRAWNADLIWRRAWCHMIETAVRQRRLHHLSLNDCCMLSWKNCFGQIDDVARNNHYDCVSFDYFTMAVDTKYRSI